MLWLLLLTAGATPVAMSVQNDGFPGWLEVRGADGGIVWKGHLDDELSVSVAPSSAYQLSLRRPGAELTGRFGDADRITSMKVTAHRNYFEVTTWEPAPELSLRIVRPADRTASYQLINRSSSTWWSHRWLERPTAEGPLCWVNGGAVDAGAVLELGPIDEACLLQGAREMPVRLVVEAGESRDRLRERLLVVGTTVRAADIRSRWIPDAGKLACVCRGTEVGPERDLLLSDDYYFYARYRRLDGGVYEVHRPVEPPPLGDQSPHIMPPGAEDHPDFSGWR